MVGHVERAWGYSFRWGQAGRQLGDLRERPAGAWRRGIPVGSAMEFFNERYADRVDPRSLSAELEDIKFGKVPDDLELAGLWTANNDARSYVVLGDPAVRLHLAPASPGGAAGEAPVAPVRAAIEPVVLTPGPGGAAGETQGGAGEAAAPAPAAGLDETLRRLSAQIAELQTAHAQQGARLEEAAQALARLLARAPGAD